MRAVRAAIACTLVLAGLASCDRIFGLKTHDGGGVDGAGDGSVLPPTLWASVVGGSAHTCGLHLDNTLWCWGRNDFGQLGFGSDTVELDVPTQVGTDTWLDVAAGSIHTCAVKSDHTLWCWGDNTQGEIGNGSSGAHVFAPSQVGTDTWLSVTAGTDHTCAIASDNSLWCWGDDANGEAGDGDQSEGFIYTTPMQEPLGATWLSVAAAYGSTCAIQSDQSLWCWGYGAFGELGDNSGEDMVATQVGSDQWKQVSGGDHFFCGLLASGKARCWGDNGEGELGNDTTNGELTPVTLSHDQPQEPIWTAIAAGQDHTCAIQQDQSLWCWGDNKAGQLAQVTPSFDHLTIPTQVTSPSGPWLAVASGHRETCAIDATHQLWCAGLNAGNLGIADGGSRRAPVRIMTATSVVAGSYTTCAIDATTGGAMSCWGSNDYGSLADGTQDSRDVPTPLTMKNWSQVSVGDHVCAIAGSDALWCWGYNYYGADGSAAVTDQVVTAPIRIGAGMAWKSVSSNAQTCATTAFGGVYCWGFNAAGQAGQPTTMDAVTAPTLVAIGNWTAVAAGENFTCGVNGSNVECWGANDYGELASSTPSGYAPQMTMLTGAPFTNLTANGQHGCVNTATSAVCWGADLNGELGNENTTSSAAPFTVFGAWLQLAAGEHFTCGIKADNGSAGSLWCWGANDAGQLADGTFIEHHEPRQVGSGSDWTSVSAGYDHACAIDSTSSIYCWGRNFEGEIGDGSGWLYALQLVH